jgi:hypothetical protein
MATSTPPEKKAYVPENHFFFLDLRKQCLAALESDGEDPWKDPALREAYGALKMLGHLSKAGFIPQIIECSLRADVLQLDEELREEMLKNQHEEFKSNKLSILISELRDLGLHATRPEPR